VPVPSWTKKIVRVVPRPSQGRLDVGKRTKQDIVGSRKARRRIEK
jgi:hypothetical protein